jgi:hypothetical protein
MAGVVITAAMLTGVISGGSKVAAQGPKQLPDDLAGKSSQVLDTHILVATVFPFSPYLYSRAVWAGHAQHLFPNGNDDRQYWGFAAFPPGNQVFQYPLTFKVTFQDGTERIIEGTGIMGTPDLENGLVGVIVEVGPDQGSMYIEGADCLTVEYIASGTES